MTAARRDDLRAVVAQCPYLKTPPELEPRGFAMARFMAADASERAGPSGLPRP